MTTRLLRVSVFCAALLGCAGRDLDLRDGREVASGPTAPATLAYRYEADLLATIDAPPVERHVEGVLYLERDENGASAVHFEEDGDEGRLLPLSDEDTVRLYFPDPSRAAQGTWTVGWSAGTHVSPLLALSESIAPSEATGDLDRVRFERSGAVESTWPLETISILQRGEGRFDRALGFYTELSTSISVAVTGQASSDAREARQRTRLTYDPARTAARARLRVDLARAESIGRAGYELYALANDRAAELSALWRALEADEDVTHEYGALAWFHSRASQRDMWRRLVTEAPGPLRDHLIELLHLVPLLAGEPLPESAVAVLREAFPADREIRELIVEAEDERLAPELARIAEMARVDDDIELAESAAQVLEALGRDRGPTDETLRDAMANPPAFLDLAARYARQRDDPRPLVPILVDVLDQGGWEDWAKEDLVLLLEGVTVTAFGADVGAWRAYWRRHEHLPFADWLVEGTRDPSPAVRAIAFQALSPYAETSAIRERLVEGITDPSAAVRLSAAQTLAGARDRRAAVALVPFLASRDRGERIAAFMALAYLHDRTLGYDPMANEVGRSASLGRWKEWAGEAARTSELLVAIP